MFYTLVVNRDGPDPVTVHTAATRLSLRVTYLFHPSFTVRWAISHRRLYFSIEKLKKTKIAASYLLHGGAATATQMTFDDGVSPLSSVQRNGR